MLCYILNNIIWQHKPVQLCLLPDDCHARFEIRGLDIGGESAHKPVDYVVHHVRDILGRPVRREHDLFVAHEKIIENPKKLFLRPRFSAQKMDIVYQKKIDIHKTLIEGCRIPFFDDIVDILIGKFLRGQIHDVFSSALGLSKVADRLQKMGFAKTGTPIDRERIERRFPGCFGNRQSGGMSHSVAVADNKLIEYVVGMELIGTLNL